MKKLLIMALIAASAFAAEGYKILTKIHIGGEGRWDYVAMDSANRRLYVSHNTSVEVVDPDAGKVVGNIPGLHGVHGIAIAADLGKGFITNGQSGSVTIFDLKTLQKRASRPLEKTPMRSAMSRRPSACSRSTIPAATRRRSTPKPAKFSRLSR